MAKSTARTKKPHSSPGFSGGHIQPGARTQRDGFVSHLPPRPLGKRGDKETSLPSHPNSQCPGYPLPAFVLQHEGPVIAFNPTAMLRLLVSLPGHPLSLSLLRKPTGGVPPGSHLDMPRSANTRKGQVRFCRHTARRVRVQAESWQWLQTAAHSSPFHPTPAAFLSPCRGDDRAWPARRG